MKNSMSAKNLLTRRLDTSLAAVVQPKRVKQPLDMKGFVKRVRQLRKGMPVTEPVVDELRRTCRY